MFLQPAGKLFWDEIELAQIDSVPGNHGILLEGGLQLFACGVNRSVNFFEFAASGVFDDARPGFIGFAEGDGIGVARATIAAQGFVCHFSNVRATHDDGHTGGADR